MSISSGLNQSSLSAFLIAIFLLTSGIVGSCKRRGSFAWNDSFSFALSDSAVLLETTFTSGSNPAIKSHFLNVRYELPNQLVTRIVFFSVSSKYSL